MWVSALQAFQTDGREMVTRLLTSDVEELVAFGLIYIMCLMIQYINFPLIFVEKYKMFLQHLFYLRSPQIISVISDICLK